MTVAQVLLDGTVSDLTDLARGRTVESASPSHLPYRIMLCGRLVSLENANTPVLQ